jgi:hypothetical protein
MAMAVTIIANPSITAKASVANRLFLNLYLHGGVWFFRPIFFLPGILQLKYPNRVFTPGIG